MNHDELYKKFRYTTHLMKPRRMRPGGQGRAQRPVEDPTRGQGRILAALKLQDSIPTKDLAYILGMRVASLNEHLVKMDAAGLITREQSPDDKRIMLIKLTDDGRTIEQLHPEKPNAFETLSDEQVEQLDTILDSIIEHLESLDADGEGLAPSDTDFTSWSERARARMGEDKFEAWMERISDYAPDGHFRPHGRRHRRHGHEDHNSHGRRGRGEGQFRGDGHGRGDCGEGRGRRHHDHGGRHYMKGQPGRGRSGEHTLDDYPQA